MRRTDTLIVGGGPAGAAAAIALARAGDAPLLLERSATPQDALCGGFLSWTTLARLRGLGVDALAFGAHPITRVRLIAGRRMREAALPEPSAGLSRRTLDAALLARAADAGARIERGVKVRSFEQGALQIDGRDALAPGALILATGKHDLRGLPRPHAADDSIGLRVRLSPSATLAALLTGAIELHLFDHGYAGLLLQEDGSANLCMALRRSRLDAAEGRPERLITDLAREAPLLGERLAGADLGKPQAIAGVPYGWQARTTEPGIYRVGDQAAAIASLAGEGIGIALASGTAAAHAVLGGEVATAFQPRLAERLSRPVRTASALWWIAERPHIARTALALMPSAALPALARATRTALTDARAGTTLAGMTDTAKNPESEWRQKLDPEQYHVLREAGTERAFTGKYWNNHQDGVYRCAGCGEPLFDSATKYDSGSGWPSFTEPMADQAVDEHSDVSHGMRRTEVRCAKCEGHLGHVFPDGPGETGLRYCINSASLDFEPKKSV